MADHCPRCHHKYEHCECGKGAAVKGAASTPITARAVFRAAVNMQRAGIPFATGAKRPDIERDFSTGTIAKGGGQVDGYLTKYTQAERDARKERIKRAEKGMTTRVKSPQTPPQANEVDPGGENG